MNKKDFAAAVKEMRSVANRLLAWAEDLEKSAGPPVEVDPGVSVVDEATVKAVAPAANAVAAPAAPAPLTYDDVYAVLEPLCQQNKSLQVQALINSFGAERLSGVPAERYSELVEAARLLGGDDHAG